MASSSDELYIFTKTDAANCKGLNLYEVFEISRTFPQSDIQKKYKELSKKYHPDINPSDESAEKFKVIALAYEYLSVPAKRLAYDKFLVVGFTNTETNEPSADDIFADLFKNAKKGSGSAPPRPSGFGTDLKIERSVPYRIAYYGGKHEVSYKTENSLSKKATFTIPPKMKTGTTLKLEGHGNPGKKSGTSGDLIATFFVDPPLPGADVNKTIEISHKEAREGCVKSLNFSRNKTQISFRLKIPAGIKDGKTIKAAGRGLPGEFGTSNGDAYIEIRVMPPKVGADVNAYCVFTLRDYMKFWGSATIPYYHLESNEILGNIRLSEIREVFGITKWQQPSPKIFESQTYDLFFPSRAPITVGADLPGSLILNLEFSDGLWKYEKRTSIFALLIIAYQAWQYFT